MSAITDYLRDIERALKAGDATEHTHRPALKELVEALRPHIIATNEPRRIECGSPDFIVTHNGVPLGYIEAKDIGVDLEGSQESEQLTRYRSSLRNLILTDYLEFRLLPEWRTSPISQAREVAEERHPSSGARYRSAVHYFVSGFF